VYVVAAGLSGTIFLIRAGGLVNAHRRLHAAERRPASRTLSASVQASDLLLQGAIGKAASASRVRLLSVATSQTGESLGLVLAWEGSISKSWAMLNTLADQRLVGRWRQFHVAPAEGGQIRMDGVADAGSLDAPAAGKKWTPLPARNPFRPLWRTPVQDPAQVVSQQIKKEEEQKKQEEQKEQSEKKEAEEAARLEAKKRELLSDLVLTGIVNNGREVLAFLNSHGNGTLMLRNGDTIQEARVVGIDEKKGEINLDYQGKFRLNFKISGARGLP
jgi:hypothetical protein